MNSVSHRSVGCPSRVIGVYDQTQLSGLEIVAGTDINECHCSPEGTSELSRSNETCQKSARSDDCASPYHLDDAGAVGMCAV